MNEAKSNNGKNWWHQLPLSMRKVVIATALFITLPVFWQWCEHDWNLNATFADVFAGDIDWSAWWGLGTFLVAVGAALIAFYELNSQQSEWNKQRQEQHDEHWDEIRAHIQVSHFVKGGVIFVNVSNVGITSATDVQVRLKGYDEKMKQTLASLSQGGLGTNEVMTGGFRKDVLERTISTIPPNHTMTYMLGFNAHVDELKDYSYALEGTIEYSDIHRQECPKDSFVLDFAYGQGMTRPASDLEEIVKYLEIIANSVVLLTKLNHS